MTNYLKTFSRNKSCLHCVTALKIAFALIALLLVMPLTSCTSKTPYEVIEDSVIADLNAYKYVDHSVMDEFVEYMDIAELEQFNVDPQSFTRSFFSDFDYTIDSIQVSEDSATVVVTIVSKDYSRFEEMLQSRVDEMEKLSARRSIPQSEYKEMYGNAVMDCMEQDDVISRATIEINYHKEGNTWRPQTEIFYLVMNALVPAPSE